MDTDSEKTVVVESWTQHLKTKLALPYEDLVLDFGSDAAASIVEKRLWLKQDLVQVLSSRPTMRMRKETLWNILKEKHSLKPSLYGVRKLNDLFKVFEDVCFIDNSHVKKSVCLRYNAKYIMKSSGSICTPDSQDTLLQQKVGNISTTDKPISGRLDGLRHVTSAHSTEFCDGRLASPERKHDHQTLASQERLDISHKAEPDGKQQGTELSSEHLSAHDTEQPTQSDTDQQTHYDKPSNVLVPKETVLFTEWPSESEQHQQSDLKDFKDFKDFISLAELHKADRPWFSRSSCNLPPVDPLKAEFRSICNKMTPKNALSFAKYLKQRGVHDLDVDNRLNVLVEAVQEAAEAADFNPVYSEMYAGFYLKVYKVLSVEHSAALSETLRDIVQSVCMESFSRHMKLDLFANDEDCGGKDVNTVVLGHAHFIGQLYDRDLITAGALHDVIEDLLQKGTELSVRCVCVILSGAGKHFDTGDTAGCKQKLEGYIQGLSDKLPTVNTVTRCSIMNLLERRKNSWRPRKKTSTQNKKGKGEKKQQITRQQKDDTSARSLTELLKRNYKFGVFFAGIAIASFTISFMLFRKSHPNKV